MAIWHLAPRAWPAHSVAIWHLAPCARTAYAVAMSGPEPQPAAQPPPDVAPLPAAAKRSSAAVLALTAVLPALLVLACDALARRARVVARSGPPIAGYIGGAALSLAMWGFALESARHPRRAIRLVAYVVLASTAAFGIGGQVLFHATSHDYFNREAVIFSINLLPIVASYLLQSPVLNLAVVLGAAALAVGYAAGRHHLVGQRRRYAGIGAGLGLIACLISAFGPFRVASQKHGLPPDVLFWNAAGGVGLYAAGFIEKPKTLPPGSHVAPVCSGPRVAADAPSIVLIFGESVRRDEVCAARSPGCDKSPRLDAAAPDRIGFARSFAVASCTEVSSAILWSGLPITSTSEAIQTAPLLWDYAHSRGYRTAYLTSQNLSFQDQGLFLRTSRIDEKREARDRIPHVDLDIGSPDEQSAAETLAFLAKSAEPAFAVLHFSNTHLPYRQVAGMTPHESEGDSNEDRRARYLNALLFQDATIGDFLRELRRSERGKRTIVIYAADHGEAWGEHGSYSHTFDLYAEQINVPLWIDAPEGTLTEAQRAELRAAAARRPVFTADVSATVLDLLGALDEPSFAESTNKLAGVSVLRSAPMERDMELSNCPPFRGCFPEAWGVVRWPLKYHYFSRELTSACSNLASDPEEKVALAPARCAELRASIIEHYPPRLDSHFPFVASGVGEAPQVASGSGSGAEVVPAVMPQAIPQGTSDVTTGAIPGATVPLPSTSGPTVPAGAP